MASKAPSVGTMSSSDSDRDSDDKSLSYSVSESDYPSKISSGQSGIRSSVDSDSDGGNLGGNAVRSDSTSDDGSPSVRSHHSIIDNDDDDSHSHALKRLRSGSESSYEPLSKSYRPEASCFDLGNQDDSEDRDSEGSKWNPYRGFSSHSSTHHLPKFDPQESHAGSSRSDWRTEDDTAPSYANMYHPKKEAIFRDVKASKIMQKMGFQDGMGLGKQGQGITEPVELSKQRGRRGLGHSVKGLEPASLEFEFDKEVVTVEEHVEWLENKHDDTIHPIVNWACKGKKKLTIDDEDKFCSIRIVKDVMSSKSTFDALEGKELQKAVSRSNPFETIRGGIFLNRAAMKMANMDKVFDFMFTRPKHPDGNPMVKSDQQLLYFADVCAGPGGFSEYVLWRQKWKAKGFGFTLKSSNDFKLSDFFAGPCESFEPHYGFTEGEETGDGDIFKSKNQEVFRKFVLDNTDGLGVHFMMADGGFSVEGQENIQEILSKQLYLCQFLVALQIVRTEGHFVCKVFDLFTEFSVGLIYLLYRSFAQISIHKPNSSRPANSERYVICKWKRPDCDSVTEYLSNVNRMICSLTKSSSDDIMSVVPLAVMEDDISFMRYIYNSNVRIGKNQIMALQKVIAFCKDVELQELRQADMRKKCLEFWEVPDDARKAPIKLSAEDLFAKILREDTRFRIDPNIIYHSEENILSLISLSATFKHIFNWYCAVLGNPKSGPETLTFFLGTGRSSVYYLSGRKWMKARNLELSAGTLLLGEIVNEIKGEKLRQVKTSTLHIVDAIRLGGTDIRHHHITDRVKYCQLFAKAMNKPSRVDLKPIHAKEMFELRDIMRISERLKEVTMKNSKTQRVFDLDRDSACIIPHGLIFFNGTQELWNRHWSKTHRCCYYYHIKQKISKFDHERPLQACRDFGSSFKERAASRWDEMYFNAITIDDVAEFVTQALK